MNTNSRLYPLDALRGLAAVVVAFLWHYQHFDLDYYKENPSEQPLYSVLRWLYLYGCNMVYFFFVLSGFIFMYVYAEQIKNKEISFNTFVFLRISRLYPLHLITLIAVFIIQYIRILTGQEFFIYQYNDFFHFCLNVFMLQEGWFEYGASFNGPSWSIACECVAYVLFFIILYWYGRQNKYIYSIVALLFIGLALKRNNPDIILLNDDIARALIGFFMGCLTYELSIQLTTQSISFKRSFFMWVGILCLICIVMSGLLDFKKFLGKWEIVFPLFFYPIIILFSLNIKLLGKMFSLKPLRYLGDLSYAIYMIPQLAQVCDLCRLYCRPQAGLAKLEVIIFGSLYLIGYCLF